MQTFIPGTIQHNRRTECLPRWLDFLKLGQSLKSLTALDTQCHHQRDDGMDHFTKPIESMCSNKLAYYSVNHLYYIFSLLAGKP